MNTFLRVRIFAIVFLFVPAIGAASENVRKVLAEAKALHSQAVELQGAWTTTAKLIKTAEQELNAGKNESALKAAEKARFNAKLSVEQAKDQQTNWSEPNYLK